MTDQETFMSPAEIRHRIGSSGTFSLNNVSGDVRIRGTDGDEVVVRARWDGGGDDRPLPLVVRRTDSSLQIDTDENRGGWFSFRNHGGVDFDVNVPKGAKVDVQVVSADIDSEGLNGSHSYKTVSGDVLIEHAGGEVSVNTVSGDVQVRGTEPMEVHATTTSGDVQAEAPLFQPVRMRTVSGDMWARGGFAEGPQHTVESVSGDLFIEAKSGLTVDTKRGLDFSKKHNQPIVSGDGSASLRFRSLSGDVTLTGFTPAVAPVQAATPSSAPAAEAQSEAERQDSMEILRALERGEIDVEEASRRLEGAGSHG